eukprot:GILJ01008831.1.p1 GENE.GILJ01008831.1~~GILJ01008831.1.p1  ORF type:complete len:439 (-),score=63.94 GILJ01008831.1:32-1348(-)
MVAVHRLPLYCLYILYFVSSAAYAILAPFFPQESEIYKISGTEQGLVFSIYSLVCFIASPIFGVTIHRFGRRRLLLVGGVLQGLPICLFGFVTLAPDSTSFLVLCLTLRVIQGIGAAAAGTATFAFVAASYSEHIGTIFAALETVGGIGLMVGPPIGGFLHEIGGFKLPFVALGGVLLATMPVLMWLLPSEAQGSTDIMKPSIWTALRIPEVRVLFGCIFFSTAAIGFLDPTLAGELDGFGLSSGPIGLIFMVSTLSYAITSPFMTWVSMKIGPRVLMLLGLLCTAISFFLLGPCPYIPFLPSSIVTICIALVVLGMGAAMILVPAMPEMIKEAEHLGEGTSDVISGIINGCFSLGEIVGPMVGSSLGDVVYFDEGTSIFGAILLAYAACIVVYRLHTAWLERVSVSAGNADKASLHIPLLVDSEDLNPEAVCLTFTK